MFKLPCSYTIYKGKAKKLNKQQTQTVFLLYEFAFTNTNQHG